MTTEKSFLHDPKILVVAVPNDNLEQSPGSSITPRSSFEQYGTEHMHWVLGSVEDMLERL
jgi:hypothetical protein